MSVWKTFCRQIESKAVRRHFGDLVPLIETCAIFEFSDDQIEVVRAYDPEDATVPPFPFPRMCCVGPRGVTMLRSPVMNEDTGVLNYEALVAGQGIFMHAACTVDADALVEVSGLRGFVPGPRGPMYFDEENSFGRTADRTIDELLDDPLEDRARQHLTKALAGGDPAMIARAQGLLVEAKGADDDLRAKRLELADLEAEICRLDDEIMRENFDSVRSNFQLGLQGVRWINKSDHYTVEVGPSAPPRKRKKAGRVTRLAERSRYIVLTKNEIADAWHRTRGGGTHASPLPHLRRGHYRTLRAGRFKTNRRVWVRATHVNGECVEWRDGDVRYRVV